MFGRTRQNASACGSVLRRPPGDIRLPCMVYAAIAFLPDRLRVAADVAIVKMRKTAGIQHVIAFADHLPTDGSDARLGIAVVARGYWLARRALSRLVAEVHASDDAPVAEPETVSGVPEAGVSRGTAQYFDGHLRLWIASGETPRTRALAARVAGVAEDRVELRVTGRAANDHDLAVLVPAVALAHELQPVPVQVIISHGQVPLPLSALQAAASHEEQVAPSVSAIAQAA